MGHVSRTDRVAQDSLFDRINLDPKMQIKFVDTKSQLADMLTKGNVTRDEWNHLSPFVEHHEFVDVLLQHFSPINNPKNMSKRQVQEEKLGEEERVVVKSKLMMNLESKIAKQSPKALGSSASNIQGPLEAHSLNSDPTDAGRQLREV